MANKKEPNNNYNNKKVYLTESRPIGETDDFENNGVPDTYNQI